MKPHQTIAILVRLFAIYLIWVSVRDLGSYIIFDYLTFGSQFAFFITAYSIVTLIFSAFIWKFPLAVSKFIFPYNPDEDKSSWNKNEIYVVAFVMLGIYFFFTSVGDLFYWGIVFLQTQDTEQPFGQFNAENKASMLISCFELILSVVLILGASGLKNLVLKIRYGGSNENSL